MGSNRTHSGNGNLLSDEVEDNVGGGTSVGDGTSVGGGTIRRLFTYDYKNRLVEVRNQDSNAPIAKYLYFCDNRRAKKIVFSELTPGQVENETTFYYDGWQVCEERNGGDQTEITYVYSPVYIDEPVQLERTGNHPLGSGEFYFHQNARADVVAITNGSGIVVEQRFYDDFGRSYDGNKDLVASSAVGNPYGFQGRRLDPETGFYYFRNRYYDPQTGRFLQRDPVWDPGNFGNQYTFVGNGPIARIDPFGLIDLMTRLEINRQVRDLQERADNWRDASRNTSNSNLRHSFRANAVLAMFQAFSLHDALDRLRPLSGPSLWDAECPDYQGRQRYFEEQEVRLGLAELAPETFNSSLTFLGAFGGVRNSGKGVARTRNAAQRIADAKSRSGSRGSSPSGRIKECEVTSNLKKGAKKRGPRGGVKHKPGRGHDRKSATQKNKKFQKKAAKKKKAKAEDYAKKKKIWDDLSPEVKRFRPDLNPDG